MKEERMDKSTVRVIKAEEAQRESKMTKSVMRRLEHQNKDLLNIIDKATEWLSGFGTVNNPEWTDDGMKMAYTAGYQQCLEDTKPNIVELEKEIKELQELYRTSLNY